MAHGLLDPAKRLQFPEITEPGANNRLCLYTKDDATMHIQSAAGINQQYRATRIHRLDFSDRFREVWRAQPAPTSESGGGADEPHQVFIVKVISSGDPGIDATQILSLLQYEAGVNKALYPDADIQLLKFMVTLPGDVLPSSIYWTMKMPDFGTSLFDLTSPVESWRGFDGDTFFQAFSKLLIELVYLQIRYGLIHSDLKPGNLILSEDGIKIIDFDLSCQADCYGRFRVRDQEKGHPMTLMYKPAEARVGSAKYVTYLIDVWSLGLTFFELCCIPISTGLFTDRAFYQASRNDVALWLCQSLRRNCLTPNLARTFTNEQVGLLTSCLRGMLQYYPIDRASPTDVLAMILMAMPNLRRPVKAMVETRFAVLSATQAAGDILSCCDGAYKRMNKKICQHPGKFMRQQDRIKTILFSKHSPYRTRRHSSIALMLLSSPLIAMLIFSEVSDCTPDIVCDLVEGTEVTFGISYGWGVLVAYALLQILMLCVITQLFCCFPCPLHLCAIPAEHNLQKPVLPKCDWARVFEDAAHGSGSGAGVAEEKASGSGSVAVPVQPGRSGGDSSSASATTPLLG